MTATTATERTHPQGSTPENYETLALYIDGLADHVLPVLVVEQVGPQVGGLEPHARRLCGRATRELVPQATGRVHEVARVAPPWTSRV